MSDIILDIAQEALNGTVIFHLHQNLLTQLISRVQDSHRLIIGEGNVTMAPLDPSGVTWQLRHMQPLDGCLNLLEFTPVDPDTGESLAKVPPPPPQFCHIPDQFQGRQFQGRNFAPGEKPGPVDYAARFMARDEAFALNEWLSDNVRNDILVFKNGDRGCLIRAILSLKGMVQLNKGNYLLGHLTSTTELKTWVRVGVCTPSGTLVYDFTIGDLVGDSLMIQKGLALSPTLGKDVITKHISELRIWSEVILSLENKEQMPPKGSGRQVGVFCASE